MVAPLGACLASLLERAVERGGPDAVQDVDDGGGVGAWFAAEGLDEVALVAPDERAGGFVWVDVRVDATAVCWLRMC